MLDSEVSTTSVIIQGDTGEASQLWRTRVTVYLSSRERTRNENLCADGSTGMQPVVWTPSCAEFSFENSPGLVQVGLLGTNGGFV